MIAADAPSWLFVTPRGIWIIMGSVTLVVVAASWAAMRSAQRRYRGTPTLRQVWTRRRASRQAVRQTRGPSRRRLRRAQRQIRKGTR